jgi:prepilin-type N-terminal cleavage/methylation domain-containing protein
MNLPKRRLYHAGFTFIELLITLAIFSLLAGAMFNFFSSQRNTYLKEELRLERDQNLRMAMDSLSRELSQAGYRASGVDFIDKLSRWAPSAYIPSGPLPVTFDANPKITLGDGGWPDMVTFALAVPTTTNPTTLESEAGGTSVVVSLSNTDSDKQFKPGDILSVGCLPEYATVSAVDGKTLTVDTDPEASGLQELSGTYPAGTTLEEVSIVSYAVFNDENDPDCVRHEAGHPLLKRKLNSGGFYPVAENIAGMKFDAPEDGLIQVSMTGQVTGGLFNGAQTGEKTIASRVSLRNAPPAGFATGCVKPEVPDGLVIEGGLDELYPCRVRISWNPVTKDASGKNLDETGCPVTGYRVYFDSVSGAFGYFSDVVPEDASGCTIDVSGVPCSGIYISVAAENSGGLGRKSQEATISDTTPPEKTKGLSATAAGAGTIVVSWDENTECDLAGYYLYRKKTGGSYELATGLIPAGASEYTDAGLEAGASYTYTIEAVDYGYNSAEMSDGVTVVGQ